MKESALLEKLKETAKGLNVDVQTVNIRKYVHNVKGGLCMVNGQYRIIVDKGLHLSEKIDVLASALKKFDTASMELNSDLQRLFSKDGHTVHVAENQPGHL